MVAYLIFTKVKTLDQSELDKYNQLVGATLTGHPAKILAIYPQFEILEGTKENEGTVVAEFPTTEAAKAWYNSPLYVQARAHREKGAIYNVVLLQG